MKKLLLCLLALLLVTGCSSKTEEKEEETATEETTTETTTTDTTTDQTVIGADSTNPVVAVDSLEEINEKLGGALTTPGVAGSEDVSYSIIGDELGEYVFKVNGLEYIYRFQNNTTDDISGIYGSNGQAFASKDDTYYEDSYYKAYRWFTLDGQYCLAVNDNGSMAKDTFMGIAEEFESYTNDNLVNKNS